MKNIVLAFILIYLLPFKSLSQMHRFKAFPAMTTLWTDHKTISVTWDNPNAENAAARELVKQAILDTWQKKSELKFIDWCPTAQKVGDIRIFFIDDEPITDGLGTEIKQKPSGVRLNFTFMNWRPACRFNTIFCIKAIAVHEFGHALGFAHEQNRPDCTFTNCHNKDQGDDGDYFLFKCDSNSIMNYCAPTWNNNGFLSDLDVEALQKLYGLPPSPTESLMNIFKIQKDNLPPPFVKKKIFEFAQSSNRIKDKQKGKYYRVKLYLTGSDMDLDNVQKVVYHLPKIFETDSITVSSRKDLFGLESEVLTDYNITADIYYRDKTKVVLKHLVKVDNRPATKF